MKAWTVWLSKPCPTNADLDDLSDSEDDRFAVIGIKLSIAFRVGRRQTCNAGSDSTRRASSRTRLLTKGRETVAMIAQSFRCSDRSNLVVCHRTSHKIGIPWLKNLSVFQTKQYVLYVMPCASRVGHKRSLCGASYTKRSKRKRSWSVNCAKCVRGFQMGKPVNNRMKSQKNAVPAKTQIAPKGYSKAAGSSNPKAVPVIPKVTAKGLRTRARVKKKELLCWHRFNKNTMAVAKGKSVHTRPYSAKHKLFKARNCTGRCSCQSCVVALKAAAGPGEESPLASETPKKQQLHRRRRE